MTLTEAEEAVLRRFREFQPWIRAGDFLHRNGIDSGLVPERLTGEEREKALESLQQKGLVKAGLTATFALTEEGFAVLDKLDS